MDHFYTSSNLSLTEVYANGLSALIHEDKIVVANQATATHSHPLIRITENQHSSAPKFEMVGDVAYELNERENTLSMQNKAALYSGRIRSLDDPHIAQQFATEQTILVQATNAAIVEMVSGNKDYDSSFVINKMLASLQGRQNLLESSLSDFNNKDLNSITKSARTGLDLIQSGEFLEKASQYGIGLISKKLEQSIQQSNTQLAAETFLHGINNNYFLSEQTVHPSMLTGKMALSSLIPTSDSLNLTNDQANAILEGLAQKIENVQTSALKSVDLFNNDLDQSAIEQSIAHPSLVRAASKISPMIAEHFFAAINQSPNLLRESFGLEDYPSKLAKHVENFIGVYSQNPNLDADSISELSALTAKIVNTNQNSPLKSSVSSLLNRLNVDDRLVEQSTGLKQIDPLSAKETLLNSDLAVENVLDAINNPNVTQSDLIDYLESNNLDNLTSDVKHALARRLDSKGHVAELFNSMTGFELVDFASNHLFHSSSSDDIKQKLALLSHVSKNKIDFYEANKGSMDLHEQSAYEPYIDFGDITHELRKSTDPLLSEAHDLLATGIEQLKQQYLEHRTNVIDDLIENGQVDQALTYIASEYPHERPEPISRNTSVNALHYFLNGGEGRHDLSMKSDNATKLIAALAEINSNDVNLDLSPGLVERLGSNLPLEKSEELLLKLHNRASDVLREIRFDFHADDPERPGADLEYVSDTNLSQLRAYSAIARDIANNKEASTISISTILSNLDTMQDRAFSKRSSTDVSSSIENLHKALNLAKDHPASYLNAIRLASNELGKIKDGQIPLPALEFVKQNIDRNIQPNEFIPTNLLQKLSPDDLTNPVHLAGVLTSDTYSPTSAKFTSLEDAIPKGYSLDIPLENQVIDILQDPDASSELKKVIYENSRSQLLNTDKFTSFSLVNAAIMNATMADTPLLNQLLKDHLSTAKQKDVFVDFADEVLSDARIPIDQAIKLATFTEAVLPNKNDTVTEIMNTVRDHNKIDKLNPTAEHTLELSRQHGKIASEMPMMNQIKTQR
ncbi:hypothetical protein V6259_12850 [Marinomonas sp. TI.3.20]|uniref:hypothetical protein n=1 Tax=Marinomonas sp. TI.3.20 TaxID=3121296 RepID=UPI00311F6735